MKINQEEHKQQIKNFLEIFNKHLDGYEKGESQLFFEHLLQAFGNPGVLQVGARCELPTKKRKKKTTGFSDFVWKPRVNIELKSRGENLQKHYDQVFEDWLSLVPDRPKYSILCNFDEFWIYDFNKQLNDPVHKLKTENLLEEWSALGFLFPTPIEPVFNNNNVEVTEEVAKIVGSLYISLTERAVDSARAQRFVLQLVVALFAEDVDLIPKYTIYKILEEAIKKPVTQKELTDLFQSMATDNPSRKPSKYSDIAYFNGGIFKVVEPVELNFKEIDLLCNASKQNWAKVRPSIFGSIFEGSMDPKKRHGHGIHFTSELDIQKIIGPTIVRPFKKKIKNCKTKKDRAKVLQEICEFKVLDPACGSGNFLYIAFRELRRLEAELLEEMGQDSRQVRLSHVLPTNFFGIDTNNFAVELAKVALSIGRKISADELGLVDNPLPFADLDKNFSDKDALIEAKWPGVDAIVGNPPYLSSKLMKVEYAVDYVESVRKHFKDVPGRADYCVYWFQKVHNHLKRGQRAGLVGTNTIRQNYSREGGLDYILANNGTITEAVSTQVWSGEANVHVSIVNWIKGDSTEKKKLFTQLGDRLNGSWRVEELENIPASLSSNLDIKEAKVLTANKKPKRCFVGQAPQSEGFYLKPDQYLKLKDSNKNNKEVLFPFLIGREFLSKARGPKRYIIDFGQRTLTESKKYKEPFKIIESTVLPDVQSKAEKEYKKIGKKKDWNNHLQNWWKHWRNRPDLIEAINTLERYIVVSRVTKRPIFDFVDAKIHPGDALVAFSFDDDYSFGILQSSFHWGWFKGQCSTLGGTWRYTGETVFETFPWPQVNNESTVKKVAEEARKLSELRNSIMKKTKWGLKDLYATLDLPGKSELKDQQELLDDAVQVAFGMDKNENRLRFLLDLNLELAKLESEGKAIVGPGVPPCVKNPQSLISKDCIKIEVD